MLLSVLGSSGSGDHCSTDVNVGSKAYGHICDLSRWRWHPDVHLHLYILLSFSVNISAVFHVCFSSFRKPWKWSEQQCPPFCSWWWRPLMGSSSQRAAGGTLSCFPEVCHMISDLWLNFGCFDKDNHSGLCGGPGWGDQLIWAQTYEEALYWSRSRYVIKPCSSCVDDSLMRQMNQRKPVFQEQASDGPLPSGGLPTQPGWVPPANASETLDRLLHSFLLPSHSAEEGFFWRLWDSTNPWWRFCCPKSGGESEKCSDSAEA